MKSPLLGAMLACFLVPVLSAVEPGAARVILDFSERDTPGPLRPPEIIRFRAPAKFNLVDKMRGREKVIEIQLILKDPDNERKFQFVWSTDKPDYFQPKGVYTLVDGEFYEFEITTFDRASSMRYSSTEVSKIVGKDGVVYDRSICEVHGTHMAIVELPIRYGMPNGRLFAPDWKTTSELYPNCWDYIDAGCGIGREMYKTGYKHQCTTCLKEATQWIKENLPEWRHVTPLTAKP